MPTVIRDALDADMDAVTAIYAPEVLSGFASFEETPPDLAEMARRRASVLTLGLPYLLAERDGVVVGYAYASSYRSRPAYRWTIESSVYVARSAQGEGVGRASMEALIARCDGGHWRQMIAVIGDSANAGSVALHRKLGFRDAGVLVNVGFKLGRWLDSVIMQRPLAAGASTPPARSDGEA